MRKKLLLCLTTLLSFSLIFILVSSESATNQDENKLTEKFVANEVLVRFKKDVDRYYIQNEIISVQGKVITYLEKEISPLQWEPDLPSVRSFRSDPDLVHLKVPETIGTELAIRLLMQSPYVEYAEKNRILHVFTTPNDTHWSKLWGMTQIDADDAWDIFTGSSNVVVAVIDTGVDYNHEDLASNIWTNPGESGGGKETNGIDDDENGYIDDFRGWDFYDNDNNPMDEYTPEGHKWYHGTHVSGTIGAVGNNNKGVVGVNWDVSIMCLKVSDENGDIPVQKAINAIDYARENGAHLSNNSYGWRETDEDFQPYNSALYNAINRAKNAGKLFVAAIGNWDYDVDDILNPRVYPACYTLQNIISVAATNDSDNLAGYSNYGMTSVDLAAPGGRGDSENEQYDIYSTKRSNQYQYMCGTSMASPHVAGVAALMWGRNSNLSYSQARDIILNNVDTSQALIFKVATSGRLNAYKAIKKAVPPAAPSSLNAYPRAWNIIKLVWQDNSNNENGFRIERKTSSSGYSQIGSVGENVIVYEDNTVSFGVTYYYRVRAYNIAGNSAYSAPADAQIPTGPPDAPDPLDARFRNGQVCFTWCDFSVNEQGFVIERKNEWDPFWEEIGEVGPNETEFYDDNLEPDTIYYYRVRAYNPYGYSPYSAPPAEVWVGIPPKKWTP